MKPYSGGVPRVMGGDNAMPEFAVHLRGIVAKPFINVWPAPSASSFRDMTLASLHQRIRPMGTAPAKMEIRTSRSS